MTTPNDNTEVVRMLRDVKDSLWKTLTPMKDMDRNFPDYISSLTGGPGSSSRLMMPNIATRLNFSSFDDSIMQGDSSFMRSIQTPESLKRKLMLTEAELQTSNARLKEKESLISIMEPNNKKICVSLENKLEECRRQNQIDNQKIEELRSKLKWAQGEAAHAKSKIHEVERQKKIDIDKLEMKMLSMQQEYSNLKTELADVKSEKAETVRKLNIEIGRLELKVSMLTEENEKSQEYIQSLKRQKNELAEKAAMASAFEKELNEATERIKVLENKIEADKDAVLIAQTRQAELKKLAELQKENRILKEEVSKNRENNIALYQEKLWSYQEKLKQAEKKSIAYAKLQVENEQLKEKLAQWDELFDDKSSFRSPTALSMRLAQYQKNEIGLTNKISQLSSHCETLTKQNKELEENNKALSRRLQQYQVNSPNQESLMKRLQRKVILLTKERDHARKLLDSYLSETTMAGAGLNAEFISQLEDMNMEYKKALEKTEKEVDILNEKMKAITESNKTEKLLVEIKKLQEENSLHLSRIAELEKEKNVLQSKCSEMKKEETPTEWSGRILHLRFNPLDNANKRHLEMFRELQEENDRLKKRVKVLEEEGAAATDVTMKVQQKLVQEGSDSTIKSLQEQLTAAEKQQRYILESARTKATEFREAVYRLTGYRVDVPTAEQYKLSHVYAESRDDYLLFQINDDGIQLIETEYSKQLLDKMELYLQQYDSFPAFLASLTMDLFSQQTYMAS